MELIETTISEHIRNQGKLEGKIEGKIEGKREGKIEGKREGKIEGKREGKREGKLEGKIEGISEQIAILESLHKQGILSKKKKEQMLIPLRQKLDELCEQMPKAA